ncbi:hypothetical protein NP493_1902g00022 [Ridgeia piscesae]|uniref:adenylate cyclase n=1 Tax=Ridgeia piscesae TaxID=27915 RepID=A0AAD9N7P2_RIDPI|nr:hypothetical protein NP493_1902g00022 [Ridgeia piscesae]
MGLDMIDVLREFRAEHGTDIDLRVGVHTGTVHIGILGLRKWQFDIFSDDVNTAAILEATGNAGYEFDEYTLYSVVTIACWSSVTY